MCGLLIRTKTRFGFKGENHVGKKGREGKDRKKRHSASHERIGKKNVVAPFFEKERKRPLSDGIGSSQIPAHSKEREGSHV